ncbi:uncharacterized protein MELLADRAFT_74599 [Melampsora larici-populina 98AG31]|uniref:Secreted protein n=1 Tax=Melampsora larici-populina (strain 98AG31 / pathotype 3-4-7) TaxID=747676 RepID=F4RHV7_MELLP|nr:uncharacterized protein MELLADRAFT_74599 [Melampsora larici-populina 98AG31]EGG08066.1 secreted protein [Melampsora larici-populina 98AG31]
MLAYLKIMILSLAVVHATSFATQNPACSTDLTGGVDDEIVQQSTRAVNNMGATVTMATTKSCGSVKVSIDRDPPAQAPPTGFEATSDMILTNLNALNKKCEYGSVYFNSQGSDSIILKLTTEATTSPPC